MKTKFIESERLIIRLVKFGDLNDLFEICSNPNVTIHMTWETHRDREVTKSYIQYLINGYEKDEIMDWVIELKGVHKVIGMCSFIDWSETNNSAELGYLLAESYWGQGFMCEAINNLFEYGFCELGFNRIEGRCNDDNINSERVMQKLGMTFEGLLRQDRLIKGKYRNTKVYSKLKDEFVSNFEEGGCII